jgi:hypothetical protein
LVVVVVVIVAACIDHLGGGAVGVVDGGRRFELSRQGEAEEKEEECSDQSRGHC